MWGHADVGIAFGVGSETAVESVMCTVDCEQAKGECVTSDRAIHVLPELICPYLGTATLSAGRSAVMDSRLPVSCQPNDANAATNAAISCGTKRRSPPRGRRMYMLSLYYFMVAGAGCVEGPTIQVAA